MSERGATALLDDGELATFRAMADVLIPAAHGMPSAGDVVDVDRLRFVLSARPDLLEPLRAALRPGLDDDPRVRVESLERDAPGDLAALHLVLVGGYYTDTQVRDLIGYPGQMALELRSWEYPAYLEEGLIDAVLARGPVWRDPSTGTRAVVADAPQTYAERYAAGEAASSAAPSGEGGH
jgi:hypothetical protein